MTKAPTYGLGPEWEPGPDGVPFRRAARVILLDAAPKVLPPFEDKLGKAAARRLNEMGVEIQLGAMVTDVDADEHETNEYGEVNSLLVT